MDSKEIKLAIIAALANGDIDALKRLKSLLNPTENEIFYYFGIFKDGRPTGEYFTTDGAVLLKDFEEEDFSKITDEILPQIGAICTCFFSVEQMNDFIFKRDNI